MVVCEYGRHQAELYVQYCESIGCKPNSALIERLQSSHVALTELDLSRNFVGPKGLLPLLHIFERNQTIQYLNLSNNGLTDANANSIADVCLRHKGLTSLDLSGNDTLAEGKPILDLTINNQRLVDVRLDSTAVYQALVDRIEFQLKTNRKHRESRPMMQPMSVKSPHKKKAVTTSASPFKSIFDGSESWRSYVVSKESNIADIQRLNATNNMPRSDVVLRHSVSRGEERQQLSSVRSQRHHQQEERAKEVQANDADRPASKQLRTAQDKLADLKGEAGPTEMEFQKQQDELQQKQKEEERTKTIASRQEEKWKQHLETIDAEAKLTEQALANFSQSKSSSSAEVAPITSNMLQPVFKQIPDDNAEGSVRAPAQTMDKIGNAQSDHAELMRSQHTFADRDARPQVDQKDRDAVATTKAKEDHSRWLREDPTKPKKMVQSKSLPPSEEDLREKKSQKWKDAVEKEFQVIFGEITNQLREDVVNQLLPVTKGGYQWDWDTPGDEASLAFKNSYREGAAYYMEGNYEDAYDSWGEALGIAQGMQHAQWEAIIQANIYALSYQLLVIEGTDFVTGLNLEEAIRCFKLACEVAYKSNKPMCQVAGQECQTHAKVTVIKAYVDSAKECIESLGKKPVPYTMVMPVCEETTNRLGQLERDRLMVFKEAIDRLNQAMGVNTELQIYKEEIKRDKSKMKTFVKLDEVNDLLLETIQSVYEYERSVSCAVDSFLSVPFAMRDSVRLKMADRRVLLGMWNDIGAVVSTLNHTPMTALTHVTVASLYLSVFEPLEALASTRRCLDSVLESEHHEYKAMAYMVTGYTLIRLKKLKDAERELGHSFSCWAQYRDQLKDATSDPLGGWALQQHRETCRHMQVSLICQHQYREALIYADAAACKTHNDLFLQNLESNFKSPADFEHLQSISARFDTLVIMYSVYTSYEFSEVAQDAVPDEVLYIWVLPTGGEVKFVHFRTQSYGLESLNQLVTECRAKLLNTARSSQVIDQTLSLPWMEPLQQLYDFLIHPVIDFLNANGAYDTTNCRITVIPDKFLWLVPFPALLNADRLFLVEKFAISHSYSIEALAYGHMRHSRFEDLKTPDKSAPECFVIGNPTLPMAPTVPSLVAEYEVPEIAKSFGVTPITGDAATGSAVQKALEWSQYTHLSLPFVGKSVDASVAGGWMVADVPHGMMMVEELKSMGTYTDMLVCSNCNIAQIQEVEALLFVGRHVMACGTLSASFSLWAGDGHSSIPLMKAFYSRLLSKDKQFLDKAKCLTYATRDVMQEFRYQPLAWAGQILFGWVGPE